MKTGGMVERGGVREDSGVQGFRGVGCLQLSTALPPDFGRAGEKREQRKKAKKQNNLRLGHIAHHRGKSMDGGHEVRSRDREWPVHGTLDVDGSRR